MNTAQERLTVCAVTSQTGERTGWTAMLIHFSSSFTCQCGNNTGTGSVLKCMPDSSMRLLCSEASLFLEWCLFLCCHMAKRISHFLKSAGRQAVCMEMGLCHAGPRTDSRHLNITQGFCKDGVLTAVISQRCHSRHSEHAVSRVCTARELTLEVQMSAHAIM